MDVGIVLHHPIPSAKTHIEDTIFHVTAHLLGTNEKALQFRIVDGRDIGPGADVDGPARLLEKTERGFLKGTLRKPDL
jgi:hypothetical protein